MRDYWLTKDLLQVVGIGFVLLALIGIGLALWLPKKWWGKLLAVLAVGFVISIPLYKASQESQQQQVVVDNYKEQFAKAQALFEERCKTAGEKIYKTVENVEGVLLLNVRGPGMARDRANPLWPDAAFPDEFGGEGYIRTFLFWEHLQVGQTQRDTSRASRSYLNPTPSSLPGYRFVDVKQADGAILRYRLKNPGDQDSVELINEPIKGPVARYAVGFVNKIKPEDRAHWVAETTITVTDTQTNEVIATRESYSFEPGLGSEAGGRQPWGFATVCPKSGSGTSPSRFFVDQILKPGKGG
jgi:hypothetical protein